MVPPEVPHDTRIEDLVDLRTQEETRETGAGRHVPRAVFVKFEFTVVDEVHGFQEILCTQEEMEEIHRETKSLNHVTCESDAKLDKNHEHSPGMQETIEAEGTEELVLALHTEIDVREESRFRGGRT